MSVLYTASDAEAAIALIEPSWLYQADVYQIDGTEPHVQSEMGINAIHYLGPIRDGEQSDSVLVSHLSHTDDLVGLFSVPELMEQ